MFENTNNSPVHSVAWLSPCKCCCWNHQTHFMKLLCTHTQTLFVVKHYRYIYNIFYRAEPLPRTHTQLRTSGARRINQKWILHRPNCRLALYVAMCCSKLFCFDFTRSTVCNTNTHQVYIAMHFVCVFCVDIVHTQVIFAMQRRVVIVLCCVERSEMRSAKRLCWCVVVWWGSATHAPSSNSFSTSATRARCATFLIYNIYATDRRMFGFTAPMMMHKNTLTHMRLLYKKSVNGCMCVSCRWCW